MGTRIDFINHLEKAKNKLINQSIEYGQNIVHNKEKIKSIELSQETYLNGFAQGADDFCKKLRLKIETYENDGQPDIDVVCLHAFLKEIETEICNLIK